MDNSIVEKLKQKATERLNRENRFRSIDTSQLSREEIEKAFHDLQVYQVELEVQNEELLTTQSMLMQLSEKYQNLYNYAPVGYISINIDGMINEGNQTFADLVGVEPHNLHGKSIRNWLHKEDSLVYYNHRKKLIDTRQPQIFSIRLVRVNKTFVDVRIILKLDNEMRPTQILMIVQDETAIKNLEYAHKNLVENSAQGMWLFSEEQLVFANNRACEILGCAPGEFLGWYSKDFLSMIDEANWSDFLKYFEIDDEIKFPDTPVQIKFTYKNTSFWLEIYATQSNHKGQPAIQFTFVDVTKRITAARLLKQSEEKFKIAAGLASDSIYTVDVEKRLSRILSSGDYARKYDHKFREYSLDEMLQLIDVPDQQAVKEKIERLYSRGVDFDEVYRLILPNGKKLVIHDRATVLTWENDKPKTILGVTTDLTKTKEYEEKLKELNATKDRFFSIIAHDLKNPFNSILGFSEILLDDYDDFSDEERKEMIAKLDKSAASAYKLLDNLLKWSRIQTNRLEHSPKNLFLKENCRDTLELLQPIADQKKINLDSVIPEDIRVFVDKDMLDSIIRNLLTNALKFTHSGGEVHLDAMKLDDGMVLVKVWDSGIGMKKDEMDKLFDVGTKFKKAGTDGEKGTGLGLILCREFIEMSGGKLQIKSEPGKGSEFFFTLPGNKHEA